MNATHRYLLIAMLSGLIMPGCGDQAPPAEKAPRPVTVFTLEESSPESGRAVSGSVSSWKTEDIGFEVAGRVQWVLEPGTDIEGRVLDPDGNLMTPGTALAQVDDERLQLAVDVASAQLEVATLDKSRINVELTSGIAADLEVAQADLELAQLAHDRNLQLVEQQAAAQAEVDRSAAELRTAKARIATVEARREQTKANLAGAVAAIAQAELSLREAERNRNDATLYSSFRGQVADVHVVPGSVVAQGTPVATVQMMNPIRVEVELSAQQSREIGRRKNLPITLTMPDGSRIKQRGYVYLVDPSADPSTRTFTLTLLLINRKVEKPLPNAVKDRASEIARTDHLWRMDFTFLPDAPEGQYFIEQNAVRQDADGHFVWKCLNAHVDEEIPDVLQVEKLRIEPHDMRVPFLGNWSFRAVSIPEDQEFSPSSLFAGELTLESGEPNDWDGTEMILDEGADWLMRPGDVVTVDLTSETDESGFYVGTECIYEESDHTYIFVAESSGDTTRARRIEVNIAGGRDLDTRELRRIEAVKPAELTTGMPIINEGVHFLKDGQPIQIVSSP